MIPQDVIDKIVLEDLKSAYDSTYVWEPKIAKVLKKVIRFYSTPDQYKEWKEGLNEPI